MIHSSGMRLGVGGNDSPLDDVVGERQRGYRGESESLRNDGVSRSSS